MTTVKKTISTNHLTLMEEAFRRSIDKIKEMSNNKLILYKDINSTDMYYVVGECSSFKLGNLVKLNIEYPESYFQDVNHIFTISNPSDVELVINTSVKEKVEKKETNQTSIGMLVKIISVISKIYQLQPDFFIMRLKELKSDVMLYDKMLSLYPGYDERKLMYNAWDFVKLMEKKGKPWPEAVKQSCKYYEVNYKQLESIRQIYISSRRI